MATTQPTTRGNGEIIPRSKSPNEKRLAQMIVGMTDSLKKALPRHITPDRMARIVLTALRITKGLGEVTQESFLGCVLSLAQIGLEPNTPLGHAYLIPRKKECTVIIGYRGFIDLARRSGQVRSVSAHVVMPGDEFSYSYGLHEDINHVPCDKPAKDTDLTHAYAVARIADADPSFVVMNRAQIDARRKRSAASGTGPWVTDFAAMAQKTPVRELSKWIPQSPELARAVALDEAPELGRSTTSAFSEEVLDGLKSEGMEVIDSPPDSEPVEFSDGTQAAEEPAEPGSDG